ncbi:MAG TPA: glycosyltransferase family 39 protein [Anaerolineales bacterium]|nr:glycosyltransferase family 39 protein [Anaerolineales bacterium]
MRRYAVPGVLLLSFAATLVIAYDIYDRIPRLEDELANIYQAQVFASGRLYAHTPPVEPLAFGVPFVVDFDGKRFSKYPPGESILLALGLWLGDPWLIGPFLGVLALAATYRLGRGLFDKRTALLAIVLGVVSPFYLVITPSFMPHAASMLAATLFALCFLRLQETESPFTLHALALVAGLALGFEFLVRPYTAIWTAVPFGLFVISDLRRDAQRYLKLYCLMALGFAIVGGLLPIYNYNLTGQVRLSLYELWWPFDRLGFGPDVGPFGFTPLAAFDKTGSDLENLTHDLHGVPFLSLIPLALGLFLRPRARTDGFLLLMLISLMVGAFVYHSGSRLYGPRYFYEAWPAMMLLSARGLLKLIGLPRDHRPIRFLIYAGVGVFFSIGIFFYIPFRFNLMRNVHKGALNWDVAHAVQQANLHRALVFQFADDWPEAAAGNLLTDPDLTADVIYARYLGPDSYLSMVAVHPDREIYFWRDGKLTPATNPPPDWFPTYPTVRYPNP